MTHSHRICELDQASGSGGNATGGSNTTQSGAHLRPKKAGQRGGCRRVKYVCEPSVERPATASLNFNSQDKGVGRKKGERVKDEPSGNRKKGKKALGGEPEVPKEQWGRIVTSPYQGKERQRLTHRVKERGGKFKVRNEINRGPSRRPGGSRFGRPFGLEDKR